MDTTPTITVGDQVLVPWGLDHVPGTVIDLYGEPTSVRAVVRLSSPSDLDRDLGDDKSTTITIPVDDLTTLRGSSHRPGRWLHAQSYERELAKALNRILSRKLKAGIEATEAPDHGADFIINAGDRTVVIEAKAIYPSSRGSATKQLRQSIAQSSAGVPFLLVVPKDVLEAWNDIADRVGAVAIDWNGEADDDKLRRKLSELLTAA